MARKLLESKLLAVELLGENRAGGLCSSTHPSGRISTTADHWCGVLVVDDGAAMTFTEHLPQQVRSSAMSEYKPMDLIVRRMWTFVSDIFLVAFLTVISVAPPIEDLAKLILALGGLILLGQRIYIAWKDAQYVTDRNKGLVGAFGADRSGISRTFEGRRD